MKYMNWYNIEDCSSMKNIMLQLCEQSRSLDTTALYSQQDRAGSCRCKSRLETSGQYWTCQQPEFCADPVLEIPAFLVIPV